MMKLNLGCGDNWKLYPDYTALDCIDFGQDLVIDIFEYLTSAPDEYWDEIMANHFLEHFDQNQLQAMFLKLHKTLKTGCIFKFVVPHMKKEASWVLSHKTFWNEATVKWLSRQDSETVYGFGKWEIVELVTNGREDIHAKLKKI